MQADLVIVVARTATDPDNRRKGSRCWSSRTVCPASPAVANWTRWAARCRTPPSCRSTDVRVPAANVLGEEGEAFGYLGHNLPQERLTVAVGSVAQARSAIAAADRLHQGPQGVRDARRVVPEHQVRTRRVLDRGRGRPGDAGPRDRRCTSTASCPAPTRPGSSCSAPRCRPASSTGACSCSAATAT